MSLGDADEDLLESRLVWIFGSPRSGSTWLMNLIGIHPRAGSINEPLIGVNAAPFMPEILSARPAAIRRRPQRSCRGLLQKSAISTPRPGRPLLRKLILGRFAGSFTARLTGDGGQGSERISGRRRDHVLTLPRSRFIFLLRDGRDAARLGGCLRCQPRAWRGRESQRYGDP